MRNNDYGIIHLDEFIQSLPTTSDRILIDRKVVALEHSGARIVRFYNPAPLHYHALSDTYLYVLSGKGRFTVADEKNPREVAVGQLLFWKKGVCHGYTEILEHPLVVLAFDSPIRDPKDVIFIYPKQIPDVFLA